MSNLIVEGFATYGTKTLVGLIAVTQAMLSGVWAEQASTGAGTWGLDNLPWDPANSDLYLWSDWGGANGGTNNGWRRVLPVARNEVRFSFYHACSNLPAVASGHMLELRNSANQLMAYLRCETTGAVSLCDASDQVLAITAGPVVVAETAQHFELGVNIDSQVANLYVQGIEVINASGVAFSNAGDVAQFAVLYALRGTVGGQQYMSHLIVRDSEGDHNNSFPVGDRKVATLFVNSDDVAHQGWATQPLHRFGNGILSLVAKNGDLSQRTCGVTGPGTSLTDLGSADFTIEGQFRFQALPTNANKAVLFGKWDEAANRRSYQLYLGGPSLETGLLVFRTSTDGLNGTVVEKLKWAWTPQTDHWYHVALVRASGELILFIDGVQQGLPVPDTDTYFVGSELPAIGVQTTGSSAVANTNLQGWQDEFRLSVGFARYTSNFAPPTTGFPRNSDDPEWGSVAWLSSWDEAVVADDGPHGLTLVALNGTAAVTPDDGQFAYQTLDENAPPTDDNLIEAALIPATGIFTLIAIPSANDTVTIGTKDGSTPAVYKFVAAVAAPFDIAIGADVQTTMNNLIAAMIAGPGAGTAYGTGTTANANASGSLEPTNQLLVTALNAGSGGNAIVTTTTAANGSWANATLTGGLDIPGYSQFGFQRLPSNTSVVDSITIAARQWKTDSGTANTQMSFVGGDGGVTDGQNYPVTTTPSVTFDTFDVDPDTGGTLSPTTILLSKVRVNRLD